MLQIVTNYKKFIKLIQSKETFQLAVFALIAMAIVSLITAPLRNSSKRSLNLLMGYASSMISIYLIYNLTDGNKWLSYTFETVTVSLKNALIYTICFGLQCFYSVSKCN